MLCLIKSSISTRSGSRRLRRSVYTCLYALNSRSLGTEVAGALRKRRATPATWRALSDVSPPRCWRLGQRYIRLWVDFIVSKEQRLERPALEAARRRGYTNSPVCGCVLCSIAGEGNALCRQCNCSCMRGVRWLLCYAISAVRAMRRSTARYIIARGIVRSLLCAACGCVLRRH